MGYSTILQFDSRPTSVVLGDQDGFKVEYVGNSLTIKPVAHGGKTNMFVFTDYDRFNFRVIVGQAQLVDYVIQVKRKRTKEAGIGFNPAQVSGSSDPSVPGLDEARGNMVTMSLGRSARCEDIKLTVDSFSYPKGHSWAVIALTLSKDGRGEIGFNAEDLFLTLGAKPLPVETLYLEKLQIAAGAEPTRGSMLFQLKSPKLVSKLHLTFRPEAIRNSHCKALKVNLGSSKTTNKK
jgi:hypothetical protein